MLSNIAYIINARLARVFSRAHHTVISLHLPGDEAAKGVGQDHGNFYTQLLAMLPDIDIKKDWQEFLKLK